MATNFIFITKISIARQTPKINLRITALDQFQKPIGIQNQISIQNLGPQNFIPQPEFQFQVLRDSTCKFVKVLFEEPGIFSTTEFGATIFDISGFKEDESTPCEFDVFNSKREIVGRFGCKVLIPGVNFHKRKFYPYALLNEFNLTRVHFYREIYSKNFFDEGELTNKYLGGMIQQVIQFCNSNSSILYPIDIDTEFESNTPAIIATIKFRKNFVEEAKSSYKIQPNQKFKELTYSCDSKVLLDSISENKTIGLQAKVLQRVNVMGSPTLDFHHQNKMDGLFFIEKFKDQINVISKDIGLRAHQGYGFSSSPGHSFFIIWYYVLNQQSNDKNQQQQVIKPHVQSQMNIKTSQQPGMNSLKTPKQFPQNDEKIEKEKVQSTSSDLYPNPNVNQVEDFTKTSNEIPTPKEEKVEKSEDKKVQSFE
eukprot:gene2172-2036_t